MELSIREKIAKAAAFLKSSPPGEIDDVFNDIRGLVNDDVVLQEEIGSYLAECNKAQFYSVNLPNTETKVLLTDYNQTDDGEFIDYETKNIFEFDHLRLKVTNVRDYSDEIEMDSFRDELQAEAEKYVSEHYLGGEARVFPNDGNYVVCIINNKYSPENYWNGRWQCTWKYDTSTNMLSGTLKVNIHYYEDGNVQLAVEKSCEKELIPEDDEQDLSEFIFLIINNLEKEMQQSINENYDFLSENTFKDLRRKLPLTKSKIDWLKIANYNIGEHLGTVKF
ncbi:hypothetical protein BB559_006772 [Furculomyces boomerangus]|uniref:F-actin-capping protein subunit alpha n=2 Tax=Harpellales TaxID=61421 RepID=A0A2T9Y0S4_9FUNG|nr:hypothetical protein BB559_006772 [Furculomyces boomerangus]PWA02781.1 hypothetical protein BB558_001060 [Smittium angustum]